MLYRFLETLLLLFREVSSYTALKIRIKKAV
jgi:hypothetical protein